MIHAMLDGDWILYAAGFAGQKTKYVAPGLFGEEEFDTLTKYRERAEQADDSWQTFPVYSRIILDPPSHFFHSAKKMIESNVHKVVDKFGEDVQLSVIMDGDGNFRSRLARLRPYKGNRAPDSKPKMYNELRQYLLDAWGAKVVYDQETDDAMAISQTMYAENKQKSIIIAVDKDMLQVPGWHLNPNKGFRKIAPRQGAYYLHVQCLTGDATDNIAGAHMVGPAKAKNLVPKDGDNKAMWQAVLSGYEASREKYPDAYPQRRSTADIATENMRLVYLRRKPGEIWMPPE